MPKFNCWHCISTGNNLRILFKNETIFFQTHFGSSFEMGTLGLNNREDNKRQNKVPPVQSLRKQKSQMYQIHRPEVISLDEKMWISLWYVHIFLLLFLEGQGTVIWHEFANKSWHNCIPTKKQTQKGKQSSNTITIFMKSTIFNIQSAAFIFKHWTLQNK